MFYFYLRLQRYTLYLISAKKIYLQRGFEKKYLLLPVIFEKNMFKKVLFIMFTVIWHEK